MAIPWTVLEVCGIVLASSLVMEFISWLILWRPDSYKKMIQEAELVYKKLEPTMRYRGEAPEKDKKKTATNRPDTAFLRISQEMMRVKMFSAALTFVPLIVLYRQLAAIYKGKIAATLPFTPIPFFYGMTHSGIPGDDYTQCSAMFIYYLAGMGVRGNVSKIFGFGPPKHLSDFFGPAKVSQEAEKMKKTN